MQSFSNEKQEIGSKTCGPVCLLNIYKEIGIETDLKTILKELKINDKTTTYPAQLGTHLLSKGLNPILINSTPQTVSPSWENLSEKDVTAKLEQWIKINKKNKWLKSVKWLISYLKKGGKLKIADLTTSLIDRYLNEGYKVICCLEESWIWGERKIEEKAVFDDIKGSPRGHFIILYSHTGNEYLVSDPFPTGMKNKEGLYKLNKDKLLVATLVWSGQIVAVRNDSTV